MGPYQTKDGRCRQRHRGGKYLYYMADLLFDWLVFDQTSKTAVHSKAAKTKQIKQEVSCTVILPLMLVLYCADESTELWHLPLPL